MRVPLAIILAGGQGKRMGPGPPKCLREVRGEPIIRHVVRFWLDYADQVEVVTQHDAQVAEALSGLDRASVIYEPHPQGVVAGVLWGLQATRCPEQWLVALGDCLWEGAVDLTPRSDFCGVAVRAAGATLGDWERSYAVGPGLSPHDAGVVVEKPRLGLGAYWFNWLALPALHNCAHLGMTDVVARLIEQGHIVRAVPFTGRYLNVTYPEDLERW